MFYLQSEGATVLSNKPVTCNGEIKSIQVSQDELDKIQSGSFDFTISDEKLVISQKPKTEKQIVAETLKDKFVNGTATNEDIITALKLLL